jgi:4-hydroxy-tetrahydrodipicolinate reductase
MVVKVVISGCCGKMGSSIAALARASVNKPPIDLVGAIETKNHPAIGKDLGEVLGNGPLGLKITDDAAAALGKGDVLIEFTTPEATMDHLRIARSLNKAMVIGTTGLIDADRQLITAASKAIPIVFSPNMSVGVNVLFEVVKIATTRLGPSYTVNIIEAHHEHKKDAPSGTAKRLQELIAGIRSQWHVPPGIPCESIRKGEIVGDHTVVFSSPSERLELTHRAATRDVFAIGALKAAQFVVGRPPGLYDMSHVLRSAA